MPVLTINLCVPLNLRLDWKSRTGAAHASVYYFESDNADVFFQMRIRIGIFLVLDCSEGAVFLVFY